MTIIQPIENTLLPHVTSDPTTYVNIDITADDIAYLIDHIDGVVQTNEVKPIQELNNRYARLGEV